MLNPKQETVEKLAERKNFFKTKCKVQGKCYNLIIEGGRIEIIVSTKVM